MMMHDSCFIRDVTLNANMDLDEVTLQYRSSRKSGIHFRRCQFGRFPSSETFCNFFLTLRNLSTICCEDIKFSENFMKGLYLFLIHPDCKLEKLRFYPHWEELYERTGADHLWLGLKQRNNLVSLNIHSCFYGTPQVLHAILPNLVSLRCVTVLGKDFGPLATKLERFFFQTFCLLVKKGQLNTIELERGDWTPVRALASSLFFPFLPQKITTLTMPSYMYTDGERLRNTFRRLVNLNSFTLYSTIDEEVETEAVFQGCVEAVAQAPNLRLFKCPRYGQPPLSERKTAILAKAFRTHRSLGYYYSGFGTTGPMHDVIRILRSRRVRVMCVLISVKHVSRISTNCSLRLLPKDLIRHIWIFLGD